MIIKILSIDLYRIKNNKVEIKNINVKYFENIDLKYLFLYDKTIKGFYINK